MSNSMKIRAASAYCPPEASARRSTRSVRSSIGRQSNSCTSISTGSKGSTDQTAVHRLEEKLLAGHTDFAKCFGMFVPRSESSEKVLKVHLRSLLEHLYFRLTDDQFSLLMREVEPESSHCVSLNELWSRLLPDTPKAHLPFVFIGRKWSTEETEIELRNAVFQNARLFCRMLLLLDRKQKGFVHVSEMQRVIQHVCRLQISDQLYNKLWLRYDPRHTQFLFYPEFLKRLAINVSSYQKSSVNFNMRTALTWPEVETTRDTEHRKGLSILKGEDDDCLKGQSMVEIHYKLKSKVFSMEHELVRAARVVDSADSGRLPREAFRLLLSHFTLAISSLTLNRILASLNMAVEEEVAWKEFLQKMKGKATVSSAPVYSQRTQQNNRPNFRRATEVLSELPLVEQVIGALAQCEMSEGPNLLYYFNYRRWDEPCITRQEVRLLLTRLGIRITQDQFKQLAVALDPDHTNLVTYSSFLHLFPPSTPTHAHTQAPPPRSPLQRPGHRKRMERKRNSSWPKMLVKLKEKVHGNFETIEKVLRCCDHKRKGIISPSQLKLLINTFCFRLNEEEFDRILSAIEDGQGQVNVRKFIQTFHQTEKERLQKWSALVNQLTQPAIPRPWSPSQLDHMWTQLISTWADTFVGQLKQLQVDNHYKVPRTEFHRILCTFTGWLDEDEFGQLWDTHLAPSLNDLDALLLVEPSPLPPESIRKEECPEPDVQSVVKSSRSVSAVSLQQTPRSVPEIETIKEKVTRKRRPKTAGPYGYFVADLNFRQALAKHFPTIKQRCLEADEDKIYAIPVQTFVEILLDMGMGSNELMRLLRLRYDIPLQDPSALVPYIAFFTQLFLNRGSKRLFSSSLPLPVANILLDIRNPVLAQWKNLKKQFLKYDVLGTGDIPIYKFLRILRTHKITLSDWETKQLIGYLDPQNIASIHYKDFLHIFMKSVG